MGFLNFFFWKEKVAKRSKKTEVLSIMSLSQTCSRSLQKAIAERRRGAVKHEFQMLLRIGVVPP
jgi:hypothetical protein